MQRRVNPPRLCHPQPSPSPSTTCAQSCCKASKRTLRFSARLLRLSCRNAHQQGTATPHRCAAKLSLPPSPPQAPTLQHPGLRRVCRIMRELMRHTTRDRSRVSGCTGAPVACTLAEMGALCDSLRGTQAPSRKWQDVVGLPVQLRNVTHCTYGVATVQTCANMHATVLM